MSKYVLITGGTKGIGQAVASCLGNAGYNLVLTYASDKEHAGSVCESLKSRYHIDVTAIQADITDRNSIEIISGYIAGQPWKLKALVFNAGITCRKSFETISPEEWERVFYANVHFPVFLLQRLAGLMDKASSVVFTGSAMGIHPHSVSLAYGVTKEAVHSLVKNLMKFLVPYGIRVNAVAPGFVDTEWQKAKPAEIRQSIESKLSLERFCTPAEIAEVYKMLIENGYFNGEVIVVDGGYSYK